MSQKKIDPSMYVYNVITEYPFVKEIFVENGFKGITDPIQFKTIAKRVTIETACKMKKVDLQTFIDRLNLSIKNNL